MIRMILHTIVALCFAAPAMAAVLEGGDGKAFATPSAAIAKATDGDTVRVSAGVYVDCAAIRQNRFTLEGVGGEVVMKDETRAHGIYAGHAGLLRIERSRFLNQIVGHHIKSRAARTEVTGCDIADGPTGTSSFLIDIPNGGAVLIENNKLSKGPLASNKTVTIMIGAEGDTNATGAIVVRDNHFDNEQGRFTVFVRNLAAAPALLSGNVLTGSVKSLEGEGTVR